jgi:hypothetical protein
MTRTFFSWKNKNLRRPHYFLIAVEIALFLLSPQPLADYSIHPLYTENEGPVRI